MLEGQEDKGQGKQRNREPKRSGKGAGQKEWRKVKWREKKRCNFLAEFVLKGERKEAETRLRKRER